MPAADRYREKASRSVIENLRPGETYEMTFVLRARVKNYASRDEAREAVTSIVRKLDAKMTPGCFRWRRGKRVFEATMYLTGDREVMLQVVEMSIILWNGRNCSVRA